MKKYVFLYTFTAMLLAAILITGQTIKKTMIKVSVVKVIPSTAEDTVTCTGKVESFAGNNIYATESGTVKKMYVKTGDKVSAGQSIMDILPVASSSNSSSTASQSYNYSSAYEAYAAYLNHSQTASSESNAESSSTEENLNSSANADTSKKVYTLKASTAGIVESLAVSAEGTYINSSKPAAVIRNENGVQVRLSVDESQIADLKEGQKVQISGIGFKSSVYAGVIQSIASEAKQLVSTTGQETVIEAIASVKNPGSDIKPGFTAKAKITTSHSNNVIIVPYEAVREDSKGNEFVYCAVRNKAKKVAVVTGREFDNGFEIKKGIKASDFIITDPDDIYEDAEVIPISVTAGGTND